MRHAHGKDVYDPNCKACRGVCVCKNPLPNKRDGCCRRCGRDILGDICTCKNPLPNKRLGSCCRCKRGLPKRLMK